MKLFSSVFNFYLNSSVHVALAVYSLTWITLLQHDMEYDKSSLCFSFFATVVAYNFVKYFGLVKFHHRRLTSWLTAIQLLSLVAFIGMCYHGLQLNLNTKILIAVLGLITFFYAIPFVPHRLLFDDQRNLREISGAKIYVIALVWAMTTVVLPLLNNDIAISFDLVLSGIQRFLFVLVLMLPFEIRDLNYDNLKLATIPQKIGIKKTKILGVFLLILFLMLEFFKDDLRQSHIILNVSITWIVLLLLVFAKKNQSKYYSAFWVESVPILWLLLALFLS